MTPQKNKPKPAGAQTILALCFWLIARLIACLLLGALACLGLCVLFVVIHGHSGLDLLKHAIASDYQYAISYFHSGPMLQWMQNVPSLMRLPQVQLPIISAHKEALLWSHVSLYIQAILVGTKLLLVRLCLLFHWSFVFFLLGFVGLIDGLAQRVIRRVSAGRESALIYHQTKSLMRLSLMVGVFTELLLPISIAHLLWIWITVTTIFGIAIQNTAKRFKKYL